MFLVPTTTNKRLLCEKAEKIIAISHNTKADLVNIFGINPDKICVIHLGQSFQPTRTKTLTLPDSYVLFTGQRGAYKNFGRFVEAFSIVCKEDKTLKLICTGQNFTSEEFSRFKTLNIIDNTIHLHVTDSQLAELYQNAKLFVFPSEYEGFGIPVLEAFACGCPIALSDASCFPEVAGNAGVYFDPLDIDDMATKMKEVLNDEPLQKKMASLGYERLKLFSWNKMAAETSQLYRSIG